MDRTKIALGLTALALGTLFTAALAVIVEKNEEIDRLKKHNKLLKETLDLSFKLNLGMNVKNAVIDHVVKHTTIPDDLSNL